MRALQELRSSQPSFTSDCIISKTVHRSRHGELETGETRSHDRRCPSISSCADVEHSARSQAAFRVRRHEALVVGISR